MEIETEAVRLDGCVYMCALLYVCAHTRVCLLTAEPQGSQGTQTRGTWDVCITEVCSSIKNQTIYIGSVKAITGAFFLEGVLQGHPGK